MAAIYTLNQVSLHFSEKELFTNADLTISQGDRVGIVGRNGAGKSTLLKLLSGDLTPDSGNVLKKSGLVVNYLTQSPRIDKDATMLEQVLSELDVRDSALRESTAYEAKNILSKLGLTDFSMRMGQLSGGQQKRVALASVLARPCDVLLLDEPTNHIDIDMVEALEQRLAAYRGTLIMVTHDRYFLSSICNRIIEVSGGKANTYRTNYEGYVSERIERMEIADSTMRKNQAIYKKELAWVRRGAQARSTKAKGRLKAFETLEDAVSKKAAQATPEMDSASSRLGKKILSCEHLSKAFGEHLIIHDFSYTLLRDDRIGIVGENGAGKSTLLNLLSGDLAPDSGKIEKGETVRMGYFRQHCPDFRQDERVMDVAQNVAVNIALPTGAQSVSQMLERFLFPSGLQYQQVARLSGGEKRRLYLLCVLLTAPNILFLDEPTNDLDLDTLAVLEDYIDTFQGAVVVVSHDRYFLDRVTRRLFALEDAHVVQYEGGYTDYLAAQQEKQASDAPQRQPKVPKEAQRREPNANRKRRFSFKEQREFETIDATIAALEEESAQVARDLETYGADFEKAQALMLRQSQLEQAQQEALERWVYLNELNDEILRQQEEK